MRFALRTSWLSRLVLAPFQAARDSYVELGDQTLHVRLGKAFDQEVALSAIESATAEQWPLLGGIGVRIGTGKDVAVISSTGSVVRLSLREPIHVPMVFGLEKTASELLVSVSEPEELIAELDRRRSPPAA